MLLLLGLGLVVFVAARPMHASEHHACTNRTVAGTWSYRMFGSLISDPNNDGYPNDFPANGLGTFALDANGNVSGGGPYKTGCCTSQLTFSGTYSVQPDCTGSLTLDVLQDGADQGSYQLDQVFGDNSNEVHWIMTDPYHVISIDARRTVHD